jgi:hypothetical protein
VTSLRACPLCGVEFLGVLADHDCERDAWARPIPQPENATGAARPDILKELERAGIGH